MMVEAAQTNPSLEFGGQEAEARKPLHVHVLYDPFSNCTVLKLTGQRTDAPPALPLGGYGYCSNPVNIVRLRERSGILSPQSVAVHKTKSYKDE